METEADRVQVTLQVNGQPYHIEVTPDETLLQTLREHLALKGAKDGCSEGTCGACTVIVNGQARRSCQLKTAKLDGASIRTIEGLAAGPRLHPLQQAFVTEGAVGCGFCTPAMIMAGAALIESDPSPSEEAIRRALQPVLCRCTGYWPIIRAVQRATGQPVEQRQHSVGSPPPLRVIGQSVPKSDAVEKVTGRSVFAADLDLLGQVYGALVRSPHHHARVLSIDYAPALALPGVLAILTARDIPGQNAFGKNVADQPILAGDQVTFRGQPVALVAAETMDLARRAARLVAVDYEVLPAALTPEEAFALGEPGHIFEHVNMQRGDLEKGLGDAAVVVERTFRTQRTDALFLEPPAGTAQIDPEGRIVLHTACQHPYGVRRQIAQALSIPEDRVRIVQTACGGAFGAKVEATVQIHLALLASRLRRPVKMVFSRQETFFSAVKRHPMAITYRAGADAEGRLTAMQVRILSDAGAFETSSVGVLLVACHDATGPYEVPNALIDGWACRTNQVPSGAQRGFGVPQVAFAYESVMDELAEKLDLTPLQIRERNIMRTGSHLVSGQQLTGPVTAEEVLRAVVPADAAPVCGECGKQHGAGLAMSFKSVGYSGGVDNAARVQAEISPNGQVLIRCGGLEMGQGLATTLAQIAAEELGLEADQVVVLPFDTSDELDSCSTEASRFTLASGRAMLEAAQRLRELLLTRAADHTGLPAPDLCLDGGWVCRRDGSRLLSLSDLAECSDEAGLRLRVRAEAHLPVPALASGQALSAVDITFCAASAQVEVDPATGALDVRSIRLVLDVGRAINPLNVQAQVEGGVAMALGYATLEDLKWDKGAPLEIKLSSYRAPRARHVPPVTTVLIEQPGMVGPYGAKGIGELPFVPVAAAIANAVYDAIGVRVTELPIVQETLRASGPPNDSMAGSHG